MEFTLICLTLIVASTVVANGQINPIHCGDGLEWDPVEGTCRSCPYGTVYNKYTKKCMKISGKSRDCNKGYAFDFVEERCVDIDECNQSKYPCKDNEQCENEQGGYRCEPRRYCGQGYQFSYVTKQCEDVDECLKTLDNCGSNMICENVPGSFTCRHPCPENKKFYWNGGCNDCQEGYKLNRITNQCEDVDECEGPRKLMCVAYKERCVKMPGLSKCMSHCSGGTIQMNGECHDIDECATLTHNCSADQKCENLFGTFQCDVPNCAINAEFNRGNNSCVCKSGFTTNPISGECRDINECLGMTTHCGPYGKCVNTPGSHTCKCDKGYILNNGTCEDVNECVSMKGICGSLICENTAGAYKCVCHAGFKSNEYDICEDINECDDNGHICSANNLLFGENYQCFNLIGSFKCINVQCPLEYKTVMQGQQVTCELVNSHCSQENNDGCVRTLPEKILYHVIEIPRMMVVPYKVAIVKIDIPSFDSYHMEIVIRKVIDSERRQIVNVDNKIMVTHDDNETHASLYIAKRLPRNTEIVCDVYLKYSDRSQEKIHSLNQYHIFASNN